jgi:hypothetical protein
MFNARVAIIQATAISGLQTCEDFVWKFSTPNAVK